MSVILFNDTATTEIYTLSLHDALPIYPLGEQRARGRLQVGPHPLDVHRHPAREADAQVLHVVQEDRRVREDHRSEEHTSELQSRQYLVCRLLLEKNKSSQYPVSSTPPT